MLLVLTLIAALILLAIAFRGLLFRTGTIEDAPLQADDRNHVPLVQTDDRNQAPLAESPELTDFIALGLSAKQAFSFLADYGLTLAEERLPQSSHFRDGFLFKYAGGEVAVDVEYSDMEYVITFSRNRIRASYLFLDKNLFGNHSGYQGDMFMRDKLGQVIAKTATDIQQNYQQVLRGDELTWKEIEAAWYASAGKSRLPP